MKHRSQARKVVIAALIGNLAIAATKFVAAGFTGSAAMLSEGIHSLVDTINELLLLYGLHRAALPPSNDHPSVAGANCTSGVLSFRCWYSRWARACRFTRACRIWRIRMRSTGRWSTTSCSGSR